MTNTTHVFLKAGLSGVKRCAIICFGLVFSQLSFGNSTCDYESKLKKFVLSNGIDVILYENFRMPVVIVGIIFHTGSSDTPTNKQGITKIIAENFIDEDAYTKLLDLGVSCEISVNGKYTEILATVNPQHMKSFFQIICENDFSIRDLDILKKQIIIDNRLIHNCFQDAISNEICANIKYKNSNIDNIVNEKAFLSISQDDVEKYFEQFYQKCHISLIVIGAIGHKNLIKSLQSTICYLDPRRPISDDSCVNQISRFVHLENKYIGRSLHYFYKIPQEDLALADSFFYIFNHEVFRFFEKANQMISGYKCLDVITNGDRVQQIIFQPRFDVSLVDLQKAYEVFVDRICKQEISTDALAKIKLINDYDRQFLSGDLLGIYAKIKKDYLGKPYTKTEINNSQQFNAFCEKIFKHNLILKITTQYNPDK
ncbi:MAG: hypothetical protein LBQ08_01960 [Holosporaceae bacterium]|jgi:hypothetical protein|nr:hypothetical protein [Holosporaceae bacterium]